MKKLFYVVLLLLSLVVESSLAQSFRNNKNDPFRSSQAFIGLFGGANFSSPFLVNSFSDFSSIDDQETGMIDDEKIYGDLLKNPGMNFGISGVFAFNRFFSIAISPAYQGVQYRYESRFIWEEVESPDNYLEYTFGHQQQLHYLSLPLIFRYSPIGKKFRPYLEAGIHYDRLLNAQKVVTTQGLDRASGGEVLFENSPQSTDISGLYIKSHFGLLAGAGFTYNMGTLLLFMDGQYLYGMHTVTNAKTRYSGSRDIPGFGNVLDDVSLRNLQISIGCYFPLKFLTKDFSPVIL